MNALITYKSGRTQELTWVTSCVIKAGVVTINGIGGVVLNMTHCNGFAEITIKEGKA